MLRGLSAFLTWAEKTALPLAQVAEDVAAALRARFPDGQLCIERQPAKRQRRMGPTR